MSGDEKGAPGSALEKADEGSRAGFLAEVWGILREKKKWWLGPIVVVLLLLGVLVALDSGTVAPFNYSLF